MQNAPKGFFFFSHEVRSILTITITAAPQCAAAGPFIVEFSRFPLRRGTGGGVRPCSTDDLLSRQL